MFLPDAFARHGARLVHLQSTPKIMSTLPALDVSKYLDNLVYDDERATIERLTRFKPAFVVAGQEPGVPLADRLSEAMNLPTNGSRLSAARRDKYRMIEVLRAAGLRCADQFKSSEPERLRAWAEDRGEFPVVVKPLSSGATDGVFVCRGPSEVAAAARHVLSALDIFDLPNHEALAQSYLAGTEYIVDTVSAAGRRYVCGVWEYEKTLLPSGKPIYDKDILLDPSAPPVPELVDYIDQVLVALNIQYGAVHAEVIMTADGPALVEMGARLNGNMNPAFHDVCLGINQADLVALAYVRPTEFLDSYGGRVYERRQEAIVYNVPTELSGVVERVNDDVVDGISRLDSVFLTVVKLKPGGRLRPTIDLLSSPVRVFMTAPDREQLMRDWRVVRDVKDRVYEIR
jgi:hypothetical protein